MLSAVLRASTVPTLHTISQAEEEDNSQILLTSVFVETIFIFDVSGLQIFNVLLIKSSMQLRGIFARTTS